MLEVWRMVLKSGRASPTPTASAQPDSPSPVNTKQQLSLNRATFLLKSATFYQENVAALAEDDVVQLRECDRRRCSGQCDSDAIVVVSMRSQTALSAILAEKKHPMPDNTIQLICARLLQQLWIASASPLHQSLLPPPTCPINLPSRCPLVSLPLCPVRPHLGLINPRSPREHSTINPRRAQKTEHSKSQESQRAQHSKSQESPENRAQ